MIDMNDMAHKVGLPKKDIMEKLEDSILDVVHMRSVRRYIRGILSAAQNRQAAAAAAAAAPQQQQLNLPPPGPPLPAASQQNNTSNVPGSSKTAGPVMVQCPVMKMGYACVECTEKVQRSKMQDHLACHIATLTKRLHELEEIVDTMRNGPEVVDLG